MQFYAIPVLRVLRSDHGQTGRNSITSCLPTNRPESGLIMRTYPHRNPWACRFPAALHDDLGGRRKQELGRTHGRSTSSVVGTYGRFPRYRVRPRWYGVRRTCHSHVGVALGGPVWPESEAGGRRATRSVSRPSRPPVRLDYRASHRSPERLPSYRRTPGSVPPRATFFSRHGLRSWLSNKMRTVSRPTWGTNFRLTASSATRRTVQRA